VLTKIDLVSPDILKKRRVELKKLDLANPFLEVSVSDEKALKSFRITLNKILQK